MKKLKREGRRLMTFRRIFGRPPNFFSVSFLIFISFHRTFRIWRLHSGPLDIDQTWKHYIISHKKTYPCNNTLEKWFLTTQISPNSAIRAENGHVHPSFLSTSAFYFSHSGKFCVLLNPFTNIFWASFSGFTTFLYWPPLRSVIFFSLFFYLEIGLSYQISWIETPFMTKETDRNSGTIHQKNSAMTPIESMTDDGNYEIVLWTSDLPAGKLNLPNFLDGKPIKTLSKEWKTAFRRAFNERDSKSITRKYFSIFVDSLRISIMKIIWWVSICSERLF